MKTVSAYLPTSAVMIVTALTLSAFEHASAQRLTSQHTAAIDTLAARIASLNLAPGFGIAVVRDTQVVYAKGFGMADVEARRPFTPQTVFYVASTTKAFTGLAAAMLDGQGRFKLDAPLSRYLPDAPLKAPMFADSITIASLLAHTHGIGDGPVAMRLAYTGEYRDNAQLIALLADHTPQPNREFRYTNLGYNITTLAMDRVTKESWKRTLDRLIFTPLGMRSTSGNVSGFAVNRLAMPYRTTPTGFARIPYGKVDANMQSAGGLVTTLEDETRWLEAQLNDGKVDGKQVIPAAAMRASHTVRARFSQNARGVQVNGYALGWNVGTYNGDTIYTHGGGFAGFATQISFMPSRRVGIVAFANTGDLGGALVELLMQATYDILAGGNAISVDSLVALRGLVERQRAAIKTDGERRAARPQTTPLPFSAYVGHYESPSMGSLDLSLNGEGKLEARSGVAWSAVEVYDGSKYQLRVELFGGGMVMPMQIEADRVVSATLDGVVYRKVR